MLYNLQPDRSVTGGAWYSDQDFESEFVEVLNQQCFKFLQSKVQPLVCGGLRDHKPLGYRLFEGRVLLHKDRTNGPDVGVHHCRSSERNQ